MIFNGYFDNAATSFPKPPAVAGAIAHYLNELGGSYGRAAYPRAFEVASRVEGVRDRLALKLGVSDSSQITFTCNATTALNTVILGMLHNGDHVLVSPLEHNAVIRPLYQMCESRGVEWSLLPALVDGRVRVADIASSLRPNTKLVIVNLQSNVNGVVQPIAAIKNAIGDVPLLVDASQSSLNLPVGNIDFLAFTGHKCLLGPTGVGGLYIKKGMELLPFVFGGTGSRSDDYRMPEIAPDRFEAGTPNIAGILGLGAALDADSRSSHTAADFFDLIEAVKLIPKVTVHCALDAAYQSELFSVSFSELSVSDAALKLWDEARVEVRVGLHCAPLAHRSLGTFSQGTLRISPSVFHSVEDFNYLYQALRKVVA